MDLGAIPMQVTQAAETVAYHEAGHAVAHHVLRVPYEYVYLGVGDHEESRSRRAWGVVWGADDRRLWDGPVSRRYAYARVTTVLTGPAAAARYRPAAAAARLSAADGQIIRNLLDRVQPPALCADRLLLIDMLHRRAEGIVADWWPAIEAVVEALVASPGRMDAAEIRSVIAEAMASRAGTSGRVSAGTFRTNAG